MDKMEEDVFIREGEDFEQFYSVCCRMGGTDEEIMDKCLKMNAPRFLEGHPNRPWRVSIKEFVLVLPERQEYIDRMQSKHPGYSQQRVANEVDGNLTALNAMAARWQPRGMRVISDIEQIIHFAPRIEPVEYDRDPSFYDSPNRELRPPRMEVASNGMLRLSLIHI